MEMNWYVVFVETGKEEIVQKWLNLLFSKETLYSLIPKKRIYEKKAGKRFAVIKKLFPGYVFINTAMDINKYKIIMGIPNLIRILNTGTYYSQIDRNEMLVILKMLGTDSIIDYSRIFIKDSKILVKEGPLYGMEGIVKKLDKHNNRAKIQFFIMGEPRMVDIGIEIIHRID